MSKRRRKAADLEHWLARAATPLFVLDAEHRVAAFNAGCEALTGWTAAEVAGQKCHYGGAGDSVDVAAFVAGLCPPPEVFAGTELAAPAHLLHRSGSPLSRLLHFYPLGGANGEVQGVLGIILPLDHPRPAQQLSPARQLHAELAAARHALRARFGANSLVARGSAMRRVLVQLGLAQQSTSPVLLVGEPGTGKEHLARLIHYSGPGRDEWFVPLDCRRLSPDELERVWLRLIDTHRPSARSDAPQPGAVYLADVEFLPRELQERLVREFAPEDPRHALPLRLLASTTEDLLRAGSDSRVRADFLAMISPLVVNVPALRDRGDDLPLLAQYFLEDCNRQVPKQIGGFDDSVWPLLVRYRWPGNVDELQAVVREAHAQAADLLIQSGDLPFRFRTALDAQSVPLPPSTQPLPLDELLTRLETRLIALALERSNGNRTKAAEILGIHRNRLIRRIEQLHLSNAQPAEGAQFPLDELTDELSSSAPDTESPDGKSA